MATTEPTMNDALAEISRQTRRAWSADDIIRSENSGMLRGSSGQPDILVIEANVSPVTIETEVLPAPTVESDTLARMGQQVRATGQTILSSIAVRLPTRLRTRSGALLRRELADANDLEMALYTGSSPSEFTRWPYAGWILGSVADLSMLTQSASVPPDVIEEAANQLVSGVSEAAGLLGEMAQAHPGAIHKISEELSGRRRADTAHGHDHLGQRLRLSGKLGGWPGELASVRSLDELRGTSGGLRKSAILAEWRKILQVNYWPIFDIARRILEVIPANYSKPLIVRLAKPLTGCSKIDSCALTT